VKTLILPRLAPLRRYAPRAWELALDFVYPPRCGGCDKRGTTFCDICRASVVASPQTPGLARIDMLVCAGVFTGPLRNAIHTFKYSGDTTLAKPLAALVAEALDRKAAALPEGDAPVLVPVPLHRRRQRQRGFNQSELLARELSRLTGWTVDNELVRVRETRSQVGLDPEQRKVNVADAFSVAAEKVPTSVVLVDDVCTTGATLSECAAAVRAHGAKRVYALVVAKAVGPAPGADT